MKSAMPLASIALSIGQDECNEALARRYDTDCTAARAVKGLTMATQPM